MSRLSRGAAIAVAGVLAAFGPSTTGFAAPGYIPPDPVDSGSFLVTSVNDAVKPFRSPAEAEAAGYQLLEGATGPTCDLAPGEPSSRPCGGPSSDGQARDFTLISASAVNDPAENVTTPELLTYEVGAGGTPVLASVTYLVPARDWDGPEADPPELFGRAFDKRDTDSYGLAPYYYLEVLVSGGSGASLTDPTGASGGCSPQLACRR